MKNQKKIALIATAALAMATPGLAQEVQGVGYSQAPAFAQQFIRDVGIDPELVTETGVYVLMGDATGDGVDDALVQVYFFEQNAVYNTAQIFLGQGNDMIPAGRLDLPGAQPRDFSVEPGAFLFTTTVAGPNDMRCCPTEPRMYRVPFPE